MKRSSLWTLLTGSGLALALALAGGCGKAASTPALGGETHWLLKCGGSDGTSPCGPDLECICGVCTTACNDYSDCAGISPDAGCAFSAETAFAGACESHAPERMCVVSPPALDVTIDPGVTVEAMRYDPRGCFSAATLTGVSITAGAYCARGQTLARGPGGNCWSFFNACLPDGFEQFNAAEHPEEACTSTADICPDSLACNDEHVATVGGCLTCDQVEREFGDKLNGTLSQYTTCSSDQDCVMTSSPASCGAACAIAVHRDYVVGFERNVLALRNGYCSDSKWDTLCVPVFLGCPAGVPACRAGQCTTRFPGDPLPCAVRAPGSCEGDGACTASRAAPFVPSGQCFSQQTMELGCLDSGLSCPPVTTPAVDASGNCYLFGGCLPPGFARAPEGHACNAALGTTCAN